MEVLTYSQIFFPMFSLCFVQVTQADLDAHDTGSREPQKNTPFLSLQSMFDCKCSCDTVDGRNPANQLSLVVFTIIYRGLYIPGGAGFLPSTV